MNDLIRRSDAVKAMHDEYDDYLYVDKEGHWIADDVENVLGNIPTIEAIPISWIYEYFSDAENERRRLEKMHGGPFTASAWCDEKYCKLESMLGNVKIMIAEWRKVAKEWDNVST